MVSFVVVWSEWAIGAFVLLVVLIAARQFFPNGFGITRNVPRSKELPLFFDTRAGEQFFTIYKTDAADQDGMIIFYFLENDDQLRAHKDAIYTIGDVGASLGNRSIITWKGTWNAVKTQELITAFERLKQELRITRTSLNTERANTRRAVDEGIRVGLEAIKHQAAGQQPQQPLRRY